MNSADFKALLDGVLTPVFLFDAEDRLRHANRAGAHLVGLPMDSLLDASFEVFDETLDRDHTTQLRALATEVRRTRDARAMTLNTEGQELRVRAVAVHDSQVALYVHPLDGQRVSVNTPRVDHAERHIEMLAGQLGVVLFLESLDGTQTRYISASVDLIFGVSQEETYANSRAWMRIVHPDDAARVARVFANGEDSFNVDFRVVRPSGEVRWLQADGVIMTVGDDRLRAGIVRDMTARRELEDFWSAVLEETNEAIVGADRDGVITLVSPGAERLFGLREAETIGQPFAILTSNDASRSRPEELKDMRGVGEGTASHQSGTLIPVEWSVSETSTGYVAIIRDIRARKRTEQERTALAKRARQHERLEALGTLASGIAHDFNNLLSPILTYTYLLQEESDAATRAQMLSGIRVATERGAKLIKQIHAFGRDPSGTYGALDMRELVQGALSLVRASLPSHINVELDFVGDLWTTGELRQLQTALLNVCVNAAEAMPDGGTVRIEVEEQELDALSAQALNLIPGRYVATQVTDTGRGIPDEVMGRIFEPFFTTKPAGEGTGMGLASAHGIVKVHRGAIGITSRIGEGTSLTLFLPARDTSPLSARSARRHRSKGSQHILVLDDDEAVLTATSRLLERAGYRTSRFMDVPPAIAELERDPDVFDAALIDYTMPNQNGIDASRMLQRLSPNLPVVLTTGKVTPELTAHTEAMGLHGPLAKPFTPSDLIASIAEAILERG